MKEQNIKSNGLYIIRDQYFSDFPSQRHMLNKHESRPYFFAVKASNGIIWMVPLSSQVEKYKEKEKKHSNNVLCYMGKVMGQERAFLTGNVIPVTGEYVKRAFTVRQAPYIVTNKKDVREIESRVRRYLALVRTGKLCPAVDILMIEQELLVRSKQKCGSDRMQ